MLAFVAYLSGIDKFQTATRLAVQCASSRLHTRTGLVFLGVLEVWTVRWKCEI